MDFLIKHWAPFPRQFPFHFPVNSADFVQRKDHWIRLAFSTCNFSFVLRGRGEYRLKGKTWPVVAPCVLTQLPGVHVEYGPREGETWDELYMIYSARLLPLFKACGFIHAKRPVWPVANLPAVSALAEELHALAGFSEAPEAVVDRMDRVCERLIMESLITPGEVAREDKKMEAIFAEVRKRLGENVDFDELARRHGMSPPTLRRRWAEVADVPPQRYLERLRMREACRLLAETMLPVQEVAVAVGFNDPLYFSRRFCAAMQMSPRDYRSAHRIRSGIKRSPRKDAGASGKRRR